MRIPSSLFNTLSAQKEIPFFSRLFLDFGIRLTLQFVSCCKYRYASTFWSFHLIPTHVALHTSPCQAGLQVSILHGAVVEAFITFVSRSVALESGYWTANTAAAINAAVTVSLCILAFDSSGGFFNPILASALTLNCKGNNLLEHFFVYWLASLTGGIIARTMHMLFRGTGTMREEESHEKHE